MGLDMHLKGKKFLWTDYENPEKCPRKIVSALFPDIDADVYEVRFQLGYWRKANAAHRWFVENVQNNVDDCGTYLVQKKDLEQLKKDCKAALKGNYDEIMPTTNGFFFGGTEYDEWYLNNLKGTIGIVDKAISFTKEHGTVFYQSSW